MTVIPLLRLVNLLNIHMGLYCQQYLNRLDHKIGQHEVNNNKSVSQYQIIVDLGLILSEHHILCCFVINPDSLSFVC